MASCRVEHILACHLPALDNRVGAARGVASGSNGVNAHDLLVAVLHRDVGGVFFGGAAELSVDRGGSLRGG